MNEIDKTLAIIVPLPAAMEQALAAVKDPDLALALRLFAMQMAVQHKENVGVLEKIDQKLTDAFPNGDTEGHRLAHEALMKLAEDRERIRRALVEKSVPALFWLLIGFIGTAMLQYAAKLIGDHLK